MIANFGSEFIFTIETDISSCLGIQIDVLPN